MANISNTRSNTLISGTSGNDSIYNGGYWSDSYHNGGNRVTIKGGSGDDYLYNYNGEKVTLAGGGGNDEIWNFDEGEDTSFRAAQTTT